MIKTKTVVLLCIALFLSKLAVHDIESASFIACGTIISGVVVDPINPEIVYAMSGRDSVYKSINGGASWDAVGYEGFTYKPSHSLVIDHKNPQIIYADRHKSINGGKTWKYMRNGHAIESTNKLIMHPQDSETLYSFTPNKGVYKSINGGELWTTFGDEKLGDIRELALDPKDPNIIYGYFMREDEDGPGRTRDVFGIEHGMKGEIYKSVDSGTTWTSLLPVTGINVLMVDPGNSSIVYAGIRQGLYRSHDGGKQWNFIKLEIPKETGVLVFAFDPIKTGVVYAGTSHGVFISTNYGENWRSINNGFPKNISVRTLSINPRNPDVIYAGTLQNGVYKTIDGGKTWNPANNGIPALPNCPE